MNIKLQNTNKLLQDDLIISNSYHDIQYFYHIKDKILNKKFEKMRNLNQFCAFMENNY